MKKINIIKKSEEFTKIIKKRKIINNRFFIIYILPKNEKYYRFGISIPTKTGNSVVRNKLKRQIKSIIDNYNDINKNLDYVIIVKKEIINLKYEDIKEQLLLLLNKINKEWNNE